MNVLITVACALLGMLVGVLAAKSFQRPPGPAPVSTDLLKEAEERALELLAKARKDAEESAAATRATALAAIETAKEQAARDAKQIEELAAVRAARREEILKEKERQANDKEAEVRKREAASKHHEAETENMRGEAAKLVSDQRAKLEAIAGVSGEQVRRELIEEFLDEARRAAQREGKAIEDLAREEAEKRAKRIIGLAIQRYAGDHVQERAVTSIHLPNDDMKGRIIGREGRNIRALQEACGVDFIVDDTPETIVISCFDPERREVARYALEKLIQDGRIHPTRIEEVVAAGRAEVERGVAEAGEQAMVDLGVTRVDPELVKTLGRLKYRYSYAQNVLKHSVECSYLCGLMAAELGQNEALARRVGLLHDIGKAASQEQDGGHALAGAQLARKLGEDDLVVSAIASHHEDEPPKTIVANLIIAADALSAARPGARRAMLEGYVKRLADLEAISKRFPGVERSFAIQAGREVRVMVEPSQVSDAEAALLAREISKRIEEELSYPGQIRVTVVRETRAVGVAK
jgi:ribonucrease Y